MRATTVAMISSHISTTDMRPSGGPGMDFDERVYGWYDIASRDNEYMLTALKGMKVSKRGSRHKRSLVATEKDNCSVIVAGTGGSGKLNHGYNFQTHGGSAVRLVIQAARTELIIAGPSRQNKDMPLTEQLHLHDGCILQILSYLYTAHKRLALGPVIVQAQGADDDA